MNSVFLSIQWTKNASYFVCSRVYQVVDFERCIKIVAYCEHSADVCQVEESVESVASYTELIIFVNIKTTVVFLVQI